jgi:dihydrofolate reductase
MIKGIVAMTKNRVIWLDNKLPWHIPKDLLRFKKLTQWCSVVMWLRTYQSIWKPLPNRKNIILTHQNICIPWLLVFHNLEDLVAYIKTLDDVWVIWGGQIYTLLLPYIQELYCTILYQDISWDVHFPYFEDQFIEISREKQNWFDFVYYKKK